MNKTDATKLIESTFKFSIGETVKYCDDAGYIESRYLRYNNAKNPPLEILYEVSFDGDECNCFLPEHRINKLHQEYPTEETESQII